MNIEQEVGTATNVKRRDNEAPGETGRESYLQKLLDAVSTMPQTEWDKLSKDAQQWYNDGAKAVKAHKNIPDPTANGKDTEPAPKRTAKGKAEKAPAKKAKPAPEKKAEPEKAKSAKKAKAPAEKVKKVRAAIPLDKNGVKVRIKDAILKNPAISTEDLVAQLSKSGPKVSKITVAGIRSEFRHSLRLLKERGLIKIEV